jgi:hypothetical protein
VEEGLKSLDKVWRGSEKAAGGCLLFCCGIGAFAWGGELEGRDGTKEGRDGKQGRVRALSRKPPETAPQTAPLPPAPAPPPKALSLGFEDYAKVRSDPNLAKLRTSPKFDDVLNAYDEPVFNTEALKATFGVFGKLFGGGKQ